MIGARGRPVQRCTDQALGFADPGVAFNGIESEAQPAGSFEQAGALVEQFVDLLPPLRIVTAERNKPHILTALRDPPTPVAALRAGNRLARNQAGIEAP